MVMELRSSSTTKRDTEDRSKTGVKAMPSNGSGSRTSSGARIRKTETATSSSTTSFSSRRASPSKHQTAAKSSSCANNEHCSPNNAPLAHRDNVTVHDGTNGQVMGDPGNSPPTSSASSAHSRQRDVLVYDFLLLCKLLIVHEPQCRAMGIKRMCVSADVVTQCCDKL